MATNPRDEVVKVARSREKKNQYTQGAKRTLVGQGWSDCSSFVRWCYLQVLGTDIGVNTTAQITNKKLAVADQSGKTCPDEAKLLPGDLLYYKGSDPSRPYGVGHVEMYIGGGKIIGHGSGVGPTVKSLASYSKSRASSGRGYIRALRVITAGAPEQPHDQPAVMPADPMKQPSAPLPAPGRGVRITEAQVNLRSGPGTGFGAIRVAKRGEVFESVDTGGWRSVLLDGKAVWVSEKMSERV